MRSNLILLICAGLIQIATFARAADAPGNVTLNWLDKAGPGINTGASWGVPFAKGTIKKGQAFSLKAADGKSLPLQNWPLAYWADGSIKWMGFATAAGADAAGPFSMSPTAGGAVGAAVKVTETNQSVEIDTGWLRCKINKSGSNLFESMTAGGVEVARAGKLECINQSGPEVDAGNPPAREKFISNIEKLTVEQSGPVRAVVKYEGKLKSATGTRQWLPFVVRLYFFAGEAQPVRMVHTMFYDGDQDKDFIRGLGLIVSVPFHEEMQNRHVRFGGEGTGVWAEPVASVNAWGNTQPAGRGSYPNQLAGQRMPSREQMGDRGTRVLDSLASWGEFRLVQPNADGFTIEKATSPKAAWISAAAGKRSSGFAYVGDVSGGLGIGLKDFWQSYPGELEVRNAKSDAAELRVWMWAPDAPAMDVRHYDTVAHPLDTTYEDSETDLSTSTPFGVARTHELTLFPCTSVPNNEQASTLARVAQKPPLIVAPPQYLHEVEAFGIWPLEDRSTPLKRGVEEYLDSIIAYYQRQIDLHNWYGFWDYGDVMHSYDEARHEWKYDFGGTAWDNSEQGTDMVLWYMFLHTGRADIFRQAEAMTRHTGEVDSYHFGPLAGLGSRHNVRHWGCGSKEARISMAPYRRYYYYLTTDERTGDVMHEMLQADEAIKTMDPMRKADPITEEDKKYPARVRAGPDWFALVGNWMTEWERTGDTKYRDKIYAGFDSIVGFPNKISTSRNLLWYLWPDSGKLQPRDNSNGGYNLVNQMGGPEVIFELNEMVDHPAWKQAWREYCERQGGGRFAGYMYRLTKDPEWARAGMGQVYAVVGRTTYSELQHIEGPQAVKPLDEGPTQLVTNNVNQNTLNMMEVLAMTSDQLPPTVPEGGAGAGGRGRGARGGGARGGRGGGPATAPAAE